MEGASELFVRELRDPQAGGPAAIVTSTRLIRTWRRAGRELHHLIDPATGDSARSDVVAVIVEADEAAWAEGFAKAALIAGAGPGRELLRSAGLSGWIAHADGSLIRT